MARAKKTRRRSFPNRLLDCMIFKVDEKSTVGLLVIETDTVQAQIGINRTLAKVLWCELELFLEGKSKKVPEPEELGRPH